jgi:hypothetical protein
MLISKERAAGRTDHVRVKAISDIMRMVSIGDTNLDRFLSNIDKSNDNLVLFDECYWVAKTDKEMWRECGLSTERVRACKSKAKRMGLITVKIKRFDGNPVTHYKFTGKYQKLYQKCSDYLLDYDFPNDLKSLKAIMKKFEEEEV